MFLKKYGYAWVTLTFFSGVAFAALAFRVDDLRRGSGRAWKTPQAGSYVNEMLRETFENWQSEFLQLLWQVCGLAYFLYVGSPSSKENDDRVEAKVDALLIMQGDAGFEIMEKLDRHYLREHGHAEPHGHNELDDILGTLRKRRGSRAKS